jgi:hypothetical protein
MLEYLLVGKAYDGSLDRRQMLNSRNNTVPEKSIAVMPIALTYEPDVPCDEIASPDLLPWF